MPAGTSYLAALGRLLIAVIFFVSAVGKIFAPAMTQGYIAAAGLPFPLAAYLIAIAVELAGGTLLILGFQTRFAALALAVFSIATAIGFHHDFANQDQLIHFLKDIAIAGGLLQVAAFGAGSFSIDARRGAAKSATPPVPLGRDLPASSRM
jgi:putative oxidoreductase